MLTISVQPLVRSTRAMIWTAVAGVTFVLAPSVCQAGFTVGAGYDFFGAIKGTSFYGQQFQGVSPYATILAGLTAGTLALSTWARAIRA